MLPRWFLTSLLCGLAILIGAGDSIAKEPLRPKRIVLIGQAPDGHPPGTHEYRAGAGLLAKLVRQVSRNAPIQAIVVSADGEWEDGPELLDGADAAFLFVSEGAAWISKKPERLAAFQRLAKRGGGLACLHWGMGTKDAKNIEPFVKLFGGCHGGPDRRYKVVDVRTELPHPKHPIVQGIEPLDIHEEFYFKLKQPDPGGTLKPVIPLIQVPIEGESHTVAWACSRPDGGRSFGFTGLHFHENWNQESYRRLMTQGVLWTIGREIPAGGVEVPVEKTDLVPPPQKSE
ncbi:MAG: ThuA domain-containing protein [Planctomycetota bacterium]|nr:ThuA domain-containing protein [Planctomycetota bacterium]MDA1252476.1 ThuA domain-containing protein [Planctomycetota bacterium]